MGQNVNNSELIMTFDLNTLDHLGVKLYSTLPPMISELISNSYDADASIVDIFLNEQSESKEIRIKDNGIGMTFDELNDYFLRIGRNRREECNIITDKGRKVLGRKGLGKLSVFGIAEEIEVITVKNGSENSFIMNYSKIKESLNGAYKPRILSHNLNTSASNGTTIIIRNIKRKSNFDISSLRTNLLKRFTAFKENDFVVNLYLNDSDNPYVLNSSSFFDELDHEFCWIFPVDFLDNLDNHGINFLKENGVTGKIFTTKTPADSINQGLILYANQKLAQENAYFDDRANDLFHSYVTGYLNIDFIESYNEDLISTDRKSLIWENEACDYLKESINILLKIIERDWRKKREEVKQLKIKEKIGVDITEWTEDLSPIEKPIAKKIAHTLIESPDLSTEKASEIFFHLKDAFSFESFKAYAHQLDQLSLLENTQAIKLLDDWQLIEAKELAKIAEGRIRTIEQFERYIRENASERDIIQKFLEEFPWLLDPKMSRFEREVTYSKLLKEKYPDNKLDESNRRIDFLCSNNNGVVHIIELKRPNIKITTDEITQALDYHSFLNTLYNDDIKEVIAILISNNFNMDRSTESLYDSLKKDGKIFLKSYDDLLAQAKRYHSEFIKQYDNIREVRKRQSE